MTKHETLSIAHLLTLPRYASFDGDSGFIGISKDLETPLPAGAHTFSFHWAPDARWDANIQCNVNFMFIVGAHQLLSQVCSSRAHHNPMSIRRKSLRCLCLALPLALTWRSPVPMLPAV